EEITTAALQRLPMLLPCGSVPSARPAQDGCADQFAEQFGLRAFRRPLSSGEVGDLRALYRAHRDAAIADSFEQAIGAVITADLAKDPALTLYTPELAQAMSDETRDFVSSLFFGGKADGKLETLLTSSSSTIDGGLAKLYGVSGFSGAGKKASDLNPVQRAGI